MRMYTFCRMLVLFCVHLLYLAGWTICTKNEPIVTVKQGKLQGGIDTLYDGSTYYSFRGIPYARPPVGQLRFKAPLPPKPWKGIRQATEYGSICAQKESDPDSVFQGSEDCLFLNVFTKSLRRLKPVMVFIHGGSYLAGSGNDDIYGPKFLVKQDVVLVTLNYRLEVLGFLCLDTPEVPGNAGMKDQVAALKWVKENVAKFGGDPDNITIFGESSGACSVTHHIMSPMSRGLFHKVIAQSGTSVHDWAIGEGSKNRALRVGKYLGKDTKNTTELLVFLRSLPAENLTNLTFPTSTEDEKVRGLPERFLPVVEKGFDNVQAFLSKHPIDILQSKRMRKVPLILGYNSAEAIIMIQDRLGKLDIYNQNPSYDVPREIAEKVTQEKMNEIGIKIRKFYIGDREFTKNDYKEIVNMLSDVHFVYDTHRFAYLYSKQNSPIYMYRFSFESDLNVFKNFTSMGLDVKGACHADELFYVFSNNFTKEAYESQEKLRSYVSTVTKLWTNFAKTSNPTPDFSGVTWPVYTTRNKEFLDINVKLTAGRFAERQRVEFWDSLYCENEPIVTVKQGKLQGGIDTLYDGSTYYSFRGIPYARPPVGQLRFKAPLPPKPWKGIRQATEYGSICAQKESDPDSVFQGSEDCLFLNVFTKSLRRLKPVMVFIHGGSYLAGSGNDDIYGPKFLVKQDVVLVTLNYRLEVLGFLCLDTPEVPGNAGMKDQVAALKWVKENVAKFGGDPDNITIFGESSGACSVTHHIMSPMSRGLFHKVIAQSGTSVHDWAIGEGSKNRALRVGKYLGKDTKNTTELLVFLRSLPAENLTNLTFPTSTEDEKVRGLPERFLPVVEKGFDNVQAFLSKHPIDILQSKRMRKVPLILGYNSAEAIIMIQDRLGKLDIYNQNPSYDVPREIAEKVTQEKMNEIGIKIRKFYIGDREFTKNDYKEIVNMLSDVHFVYDTHRFAYLYSKQNSPIYMYRFSFESDLNVFKNFTSMGLDVKGACHADELFYVFSNNFTKEAYESQEKLRSYVSTVTKLWTNFAKTSNPTPDFSGVTWPVYTTRNKEFLDINVKLTAGRFAERQRVEFWDSLYCEVGLPCIKNN